MSSATTTNGDIPASNAATPALPVNVVFFDGVCGLCNLSVDFILSRDRRRTIFFSPLQGETARRCGVVGEGTSATLTAAPITAASIPTFDTFVWRDANGRHFIRSAASVRVLWQLGGFWSLIAALMWLIPRPLRDLGYRLIAANRYRLFGRKEACRLPTPAERAQFLD